MSRIVEYFKFRVLFTLPDGYRGPNIFLKYLTCMILLVENYSPPVIPVQTPILREQPLSRSPHRLAPHPPLASAAPPLGTSAKSRCWQSGASLAEVKLIVGATLVGLFDLI